MNKLKQVSIQSLIWAAVIVALINWVTALGFYGSYPPVQVYSSVVLWVMAIVCGVQGVYVRKKLEDEEVGFDRTQLNPQTVAFSAMLGQAVAWIGAVVSGAYVGLLAFSLINGAHLAATQEDLPGVIAGVLGGGLAAAAGVWLERGCVVPPSDGTGPNSRSGALDAA